MQPPWASGGKLVTPWSVPCNPVSTHPTMQDWNSPSLLPHQNLWEQKLSNSSLHPEGVSVRSKLNSDLKDLFTIFLDYFLLLIISLRQKYWTINDPSLLSYYQGILWLFFPLCNSVWKPPHPAKLCPSEFLLYCLDMYYSNISENTFLCLFLLPSTRQAHFGWETKFSFFCRSLSAI